MNKFLIIFTLYVFSVCGILAQNSVKGIIKDGEKLTVLKGVLVEIKGTSINQKTTADGMFLLENISKGNHFLIITKKGYEAQKIQIILKGKPIDLGTIFLYKIAPEEKDISTIIISDEELNDENNTTDNISGLLQSSQDVFLRTAAFEWSASFFRLRGLDASNSKVLINGIEMNKLYNGRPQWGNWGGLNDMFRNQKVVYGLLPSSIAFGGVLGTTNFNTRASLYRKGSKVSYSSSNRNYNHRVMASHNTGILKNDWSFAFASSARIGKEAFVKGTSYNAYSVFASAEKKLNDAHSINFSTIVASNKRGKSAPHTQEVYDLKGIKYNEYWGFHDNEQRNSRIKSVFEPIVMLNHYWDISEKTELNTNIMYQFGKIGNSRLDYNGGTHPSPTYYQKLPSYWLSRNDFQQAYEATERFKNDGQLDWESLYNANITNAEQGKNAAYLLYEDRNDNKQFTINSIVNTEITDNILLTGKITYKKLQSENFAKALDLLGGLGYKDINRFAKINTAQRQNDLQNLDRVVKVGDKLKYNYKITSDVIRAFSQAQFNYKKVDFHLAGEISQTSYQREGLYQNGRYKNTSLGESEKQQFTGFSAKSGAVYKITGRHLIGVNSGYINKAPTIQNTFSNIRESNSVVRNLTNEKILSADASYFYRSPKIQGKITGFYTKIQDATKISYFYQQGLFGEAFVQEITTGINTKHFGAELGIETTITDGLKIKGAMNFGQYTYDNNPNVYVTSDNYISSENSLGINDLGKSYLKNYKVASGPHKTYSLGLDYRSPNYWWFTTTANYFNDAYVNVSAITRSDAFYKSFDGLPINNIDNSLAKKLLRQEKFDGYILVNAVGGKSWRVGRGYKILGFTLGISNVLNQSYKTGGYEQSRKPDYTQLLEEYNRPKKLFGAKYWYGLGQTYFLNMYYRF